MLSKLLKTAAAGNAAGEALYVEDVFSTYVYTGTSSARSITNGIDLDGEGGLVWIKNRGANGSHRLYDTNRGVYKDLRSDQAYAENTDSTQLTAFNSNGFSLGADAGGLTNYITHTFASWTFRKAPKFFDVVTYTGDGTSSRSISHNLGSVPGMIITKERGGESNWFVGHIGIRNNSSDNTLQLNSTNEATSANYFRNNATSTTFGLTGAGGELAPNESGRTFVAYLFAHNDGDGEFGENADQDIIKCGSYVGNGSSSGNTINLGFEPQWIMVKSATRSGEWYMFDTMRGLVTASGGNDAALFANLSNQENSTVTFGQVESTGFTVFGSSGDWNENGQTYIYIAIRRGPMKTPESGTEVFAVDSGGNGDSPSFISNFPVDLGIRHPDRDQGGNGTYWTDRLRGNKYLKADSTAAEVTITAGFDQMDGFQIYSALSDAVGWMFRRAPGFFDVVAYTGTGSAHSEAHNLGVAPEMMIIKPRDLSYQWSVWHKDIASTSPYYEIVLNSSNTQTDENNTNSPFSGVPTSTGFPLPSGTASASNRSGFNYIAYLFATLDGISKVGSYTGNGSTQTINCGFSTGARFVLIKATTYADNWYVFDTERGIVAGNDPYFAFDITDPQINAYDLLDPDSSGFIINSNNRVNRSGTTFIFLAIA